jgi:hypothetical protein
MWLAQFVCAPQFFKTPKGLCGHTVYLCGLQMNTEYGTTRYCVEHTAVNHLKTIIPLSVLPKPRSYTKIGNGSKGQTGGICEQCAEENT